jgi:endogenous inhibitor of DNA gyrase (YacG/DUF329 family)
MLFIWTVDVLDAIHDVLDVICKFLSYIFVEIILLLAFVFIFWPAFVAVLIVILIIKKRKKYINQVMNTEGTKLRTVKEYIKTYPSFSAARFRKGLSDLFSRYQNALCTKDPSGLRNEISSLLYAQLESEIKGYRRISQTYHADKLYISQDHILGWRNENDRDVMIVSLKTQFREYVTDDNTGEVVSGSKDNFRIKNYLLECARTAGVRTPESVKESASRTCPKCGADVKMNQSAKCPYCGSMLRSSDFDWILSSINEISPVVKKKKKRFFNSQ